MICHPKYITWLAVVGVLICAARSAKVLDRFKRTGCRDLDYECQIFAARGECHINPVWMNPNCAFSCGLCGGVQVIRVPTPVVTNVGGGYGAWSSWTQCPTYCGQSVSQQRHRKCNAYGGQCSGSGQEQRACQCQTVPWSNWGSCSSTCGTGGYQTRSQSCPTYGGCSGSGSSYGQEQRPCTPPPQPCAYWSEWGSWSQSTVSCVSAQSYGQQGNAGMCSRSRTCKPYGANCAGSSTDQQPCNYSPPQCAQWSDWGSWSQSQLSCVSGDSYGQPGAAGTCQRTRTCMPAGGQCSGQASQQGPCQSSPPRCAEWNNWGAWSEPALTCLPTDTYGGAYNAVTCTRQRTCSPQGGQCYGDSAQSQTCSNNPPRCAQWGPWGSWSQPSYGCVPAAGYGAPAQTLNAMCARNRQCNPSGGYCSGDQSQELPCKTKPSCPGGTAIVLRDPNVLRDPKSSSSASKPRPQKSRPKQIPLTDSALKDFSLKDWG